MFSVEALQHFSDKIFFELIVERKNDSQRERDGRDEHLAASDASHVSNGKNV